METTQNSKAYLDLMYVWLLITSRCSDMVIQYPALKRVFTSKGLEHDTYREQWVLHIEPKITGLWTAANTGRSDHADTLAVSAQLYKAQRLRRILFKLEEYGHDH
ncbi:hypothetical protein GR11A_00219 [Vibrio phage vB_VcorM_GR11A]|nr:hypothetical protein GR11A_00219 [Vibrio phage vB_VcorM_GR11A]